MVLFILPDRSREVLGKLERFKYAFSVLEDYHLIGILYVIIYIN